MQNTVVSGFNMVVENENKEIVLEKHFDFSGRPNDEWTRELHKILWDPKKYFDQEKINMQNYDSINIVVKNMTEMDDECMDAFLKVIRHDPEYIESIQK